jgi:hypothetical protein
MLDTSTSTSATDDTVTRAAVALVVPVTALQVTVQAAPLCSSIAYSIFPKGTASANVCTTLYTVIEQTVRAVVAAVCAEYNAVSVAAVGDSALRV